MGGAQSPAPAAKPGQGLEHVLSSAALTWQCDAVHGEKEMNMIKKDENDRKNMETDEDLKTIIRDDENHEQL